MSLEATRWAWRQAVKGTHKLVLLSLADRADDRHTCYPSVDRLHEDTCLNRKTIMEAIAELEELGLIEVHRLLGAGNKYRLLVAALEVHTSTETGTSPATEIETKTSTENGTTELGTGTESGTTPVPKTGHPPVPKTVLKSTKESTKESTNVYKPLFEAFWGCYPRREKKPDAEKAFKALNPDQHVLEKMTTDIQRRMASGRWADKKFIPHPGTYIRNRRWEDEPEQTAQVVQMAPKKQAGMARSFSEVNYREGVADDGSF